MLNMSIILFRYEQFVSTIYNAISKYYFLCKLITDLQNSINLSWYEHKSYAQKFGSAKKIGGSVRVWQKIHGSVVSYILYWP